jgi:hypothetical protein
VVTVFSNVLKKIRDLWRRLIHTDALTLAAVVMTIIGAWSFLEVADEVTEGGSGGLTNARSEGATVSLTHGSQYAVREPVSSARTRIRHSCASGVHSAQEAGTWSIAAFTSIPVGRLLPGSERSGP